MIFFEWTGPKGTRRWKVKLSGYAPLELRTKFCCPDTAYEKKHALRADSPHVTL
jgi:hypothetical protein